MPRDFAAAASLYRKAAERGYGGAQNNLAIACALGQGVARNPVEAYKWFALAARHGDQNGEDIRANLVKGMTPEQIAEGEKQVRDFTAKE